MSTSTPTFEEYLDAVYRAYQDLLSATLHPAADHSTMPASGGVYVFYENGQSIYVGRTRNMRRRLRQHSHPNSTHYSASFAFLMARKEAALPALPKLTREQVAKELDSPFRHCRERVGLMSVRWVAVEDPIVQSLLEVYASVTLRTTEHYNSFQTT